MENENKEELEEIPEEKEIKHRKHKKKKEDIAEELKTILYQLIHGTDTENPDRIRAIALLDSLTEKSQTENNTYTLKIELIPYTTTTTTTLTDKQIKQLHQIEKDNIEKEKYNVIKEDDINEDEADIFK